MTYFWAIYGTGIGVSFILFWLAYNKVDSFKDDVDKIPERYFTPAMVILLISWPAIVLLMILPRVVSLIITGRIKDKLREWRNGK